MVFLNWCHTSRKGYIENDLYFNCLMRHHFMKYSHHINISLNALRYFVYEWCHSWRLSSKFRRSIFGFKIYGCRMNRFSFSTQEILNFKRYWCCIPRTSQIRKCNILFILKCGVIHRERAASFTPCLGAKLRIYRQILASRYKIEWLYYQLVYIFFKSGMLV